MDRLSLHASLHATDPTTFPEAHMSMAQLRDDLLRTDFSAARRKILWEKVQKKVEANSNVRPMVRENRAGDVGRVWEWVGATRYIESPAENTRRRSGRVSFVDEDRYLEPAPAAMRDNLALAKTSNAPAVAAAVPPPVQQPPPKRKTGLLGRFTESRSYF
jgi:hypothetical protein